MTALRKSVIQPNLPILYDVTCTMATRRKVEVVPSHSQVERTRNLKDFKE